MVVRGKDEKDVDPIDGLVMRLMERNARKYRRGVRWWGFCALSLLVVGLVFHSAWVWALAAADGVLLLTNLVMMVVIHSDAWEVQARKTIIAEARYRRAGGR